MADQSQGIGTAAVCDDTDAPNDGTHRIEVRGANVQRAALAVLGRDFLHRLFVDVLRNQPLERLGGRHGVGAKAFDFPALLVDILRSELYGDRRELRPIAGLAHLHLSAALAGPVMLPRRRRVTQRRARGIPGTSATSTYSCGRGKRWGTCAHAIASVSPAMSREVTTRAQGSGMPEGLITNPCL